jgi:hypothetical protein
MRNSNRWSGNRDNVTYGVTISSVILVMCCIMLLSPLSGKAQIIRFVTPTGAGDKTGSNWMNASDKLQETINLCHAGDSVFVAAGIYYGGFFMKNGVHVYGGFTGNEITTLERKPPSLATYSILDGSSSSRVITQSSVFDTKAIWDGFVIQHGVSLEGGGVYLKKNGTLRKCIIRNNVAGIPSPGEWLPAQGGIVFRVDPVLKKGWVIALENHGITFQTGTQGTVARDTLTALADMDGAQNTTTLTEGRATTVIKQYRAPAPANLLNDWYIPAEGEWGLFINSDGKTGTRTELCKKVEEALNAASGKDFGNQKFWSSTTHSTSGLPRTWYVNFETNTWGSMNIFQYNRLRGVRAFSISELYGRGGGIFADAESTIEGCLVYENQSQEGSGIYTKNMVTISNSTIVMNSQIASSNGSVTPQYINPYAVVMDASNSFIKNSIVWGNKDMSGKPSNLNTITNARYTGVEELPSGQNGNITLSSNADDGPGFVNPAQHNFRLRINSVCLGKGNIAMIPSGLTSDLLGNTFTGLTTLSLGAYGASPGIADPPAAVINIIAPANSKWFAAGSSITLEAIALYREATQVSFYSGNTLIGTVDKSPYQIVWTPSAGVYAITAIATYANAETVTSAETVIIVSTQSAGTVPSITITSPAQDTTIEAASTITLEAEALLTDITHVSFYANNTLIGTDNAENPYRISWTPPAGTYSLTAKAFNTKNESVTSHAVQITANEIITTTEREATADNLLPYPNPFCGKLSIPVILTKPGPVVFSIYNAQGKPITTFHNNNLKAGHHTLEWTTTNHDPIPEGIYLYTLFYNEEVVTGKIIKKNE